MGRWLAVFALLIAWGVGATIFCDQNGMLNGFCGVFLRVLSGYALIIGLTHFILLLLPKCGIGDDPRTE